MKFEVPGVPVAQPRQRHSIVAGHVRNYTPSNHPANEFKATVKIAWTNARLPSVKAARVSITFVLPRPQCKLRKKDPEGRIPYLKKPDTDNLEKCVLDALNGLAWRDDSCVWDLRGVKVYAARGESAKTEIEIEETESEQS